MKKCQALGRASDREWARVRVCETAWREGCSIVSLLAEYNYGIVRLGGHANYVCRPLGIEWDRA